VAYSDFNTLRKVELAFELTIDESQSCFSAINPIEPSPYLQQTLQEYIPIANAINTEKARSEMIIAPVLLEIRRMFDTQVGFFSGTEFSVEPEVGLNGYCDYILTASPDRYEIRSPVITLVEAKNENIKGGLGQCIAEMVGAQRFNQLQTDSKTTLQETLYGAVTTGVAWKFLKITGHQVAIDRDDYYIKEINQILGILAHPFNTRFSQ
jgi:hypothetical protein